MLVAMVPCMLMWLLGCSRKLLVDWGSTRSVFCSLVFYQRFSETVLKHSPSRCKTSILLICADFSVVMSYMKQTMKWAELAISTLTNYVLRFLRDARDFSVEKSLREDKLWGTPLAPPDFDVVLCSRYENSWGHTHLHDTLHLPESSVYNCPSHFCGTFCGLQFSLFFAYLHLLLTSDAFSLLN
jgi:hypothetical protein